ncbi:uncharacterized protein [Engystomops pustulosus]|uniref:uncharacterized protein n=1 Tax=Engystomops pustulosus TaxID=76066 RepID=UPI003AFAF6D8
MSDSDTLEDVILSWYISQKYGERSDLWRSHHPRRKRRRWVHPIVSQRLTKGVFHTLYLDLRKDPDKFISFCRLSITLFDQLVAELRPALTFHDTRLRKCISVEERLLVTLRFLATGNSFSSLHFTFLIGTSTIARIVNHTCVVIWSHLRRTMMPPPNAQQWLDIAHGFEEKANFPNCIGALDGKHIRVQKPPNSGSRYFNYKRYFSVVLLALADSNYRFIIVDIGAHGSAADAGIFRVSRMSKRLSDRQLDIPEPRILPGSSGPALPFVIVADEGFALSYHVMRPFPRRRLDLRCRHFNIRLGRARRFVECAFGILASRWRVFQSSMQLSPSNVICVIKACIILHNYCRMYDPPENPQPEIYADVATTEPTHHARPALAGMRIRNQFADFFYHNSVD